MEVQKGRIRDVERKGKMVENGWFWGKKKKKRNHYDAQNPVWSRKKTAVPSAEIKSPH